MSVHATTLIAIATTGALCDECPTPWTVEKIDPWKGPGTHVWDVLSADGCSLVYLPPGIDGPAFVAWVNENAPSVLATLTVSGELVIEPCNRATPAPRAVDPRAYLPVCARCQCPIEPGEQMIGGHAPVQHQHAPFDEPERHADAEDCVVALLRARCPIPEGQR